MDNFNNKKSTPRTQSMDGFISGSDRPRKQVISGFGSAYSPSRHNGSRARRATAQSFRARRSEIGTQLRQSGATSDQPSHQRKQQPELTASLDTLDLPDEQTERRGLLRWRKQRKKRRLPARLARSFAALVVIGLIGVGAVFGYGYFKTQGIFRGDGTGAAALQENVEPEQLAGEGDGRVNILLLGKGGVGHEAPDLTDTILLASIDPIQNEAALISIPRDLYVRDAGGYSSKINAVYANAKQSVAADVGEGDVAEDAGLDAIKQTVAEVLGLPVHYYAMIDFASFERAIDTVGGVTIDVEERLYDPTVAWLLDGNPVIAETGLQTFDGERALLYARSRLGSARGDFDRTERQREILVALQSKILSLDTFSNPFKVVELVDTLGDGVRTDLNGLGEIRRLYEIGQEIGSDAIVSVGLADPPNVLVTTSSIGDQSVVVPVEGLYQYGELQSYIRNTVQDPYLQQEGARVAILNGTTISGFASSRSAELRSYGYNVVLVDNAPTSDYTQSQLVDLTGGALRYTKSYLERRLDLSATTQPVEGLPSSEDIDFVIILGTDEVDQASN